MNITRALRFLDHFPAHTPRIKALLQLPTDIIGLGRAYANVVSEVLAVVESDSASSRAIESMSDEWRLLNNKLRFVFGEAYHE